MPTIKAAEIVAGAADTGDAGQCQRLDIGAQCMTEGALDRVDAGAGKFVTTSRRIVNDVDVVAGAALHVVGAEAADEKVVAERRR